MPGSSHHTNMASSAARIQSNVHHPKKDPPIDCEEKPKKRKHGDADDSDDSDADGFFRAFDLKKYKSAPFIINDITCPSKTKGPKDDINAMTAKNAALEAENDALKKENVALKERIGKTFSVINSALKRKKASESCESSASSCY